MINVNGQVYVTNLKEVSPRLVVGDVYCHEKINEKEYNTTFLKANFVGEAIVHLISKNVKNKDKIYIDKAIYKDRKYTNKEGKEVVTSGITVFKISSLEENKEVKNRFER